MKSIPWLFSPKYLPKQMKPQQLSPLTMTDSASGEGSARCAALPTVTAMVVAIASSLVLTLAGCASSAGIAPVAQAQSPAGLDAQVSTPAVAADWWVGFGDASLTELIQRSLAGNPTLKVTQARFARAQAAVAGAQAAEGPQVSGVFDVTRQRFSATSIYPPPLGGSIRTLGTLQANASWELDLFGRNRASLDAAVGAQRAAQADTAAARILLAANVARTYVQLARLVEQRTVAERALAQRDETLSLIRQRVDGGRTRPSSCARGRAPCRNRANRSKRWPSRSRSHATPSPR